MADFWDKQAARYESTPREQRFQEALDGARRWLGPDDVVLDVGCATGISTRELAPHVARIRGIDTSAIMVRTAEEHGTDAWCTDIHDERLDDEAWTAMVVFNVLHLTDAEAVLARAADLLPVGGLLITQTPCLRAEPWWKRLFIAILTNRLGLRIRQHSPDGLRRAVERDFDVVAFDDAENQSVWIVGRKANRHRDA